MKSICLSSPQHEPHSIIFLDVPPEIGLARAKARGGEFTRFDAREEVYHRRVREGYVRIAGLIPVRTKGATRVEVIDASRPQEEVQARVLASLWEAHALAA